MTIKVLLSYAGPCDPTTGEAIEIETLFNFRDRLVFVNLDLSLADINPTEGSYGYQGYLSKPTGEGTGDLNFGGGSFTGTGAGGGGSIHRGARSLGVKRDT